MKLGFNKAGVARGDSAGNAWKDALAGAALLLMAGADVSSVVFSLVQMIVMLLLNRVYFTKRKSMFT